MTAVVRPRSPHAHGPASTCPACRDCTSCAGGRAFPRRYRVARPAPAGDPRLPLYVCTGCEGRGRACLNIAPDLERTAPR